MMEVLFKMKKLSSLDEYQDDMAIKIEDKEFNKDQVRYIKRLENMENQADIAIGNGNTNLKRPGKKKVYSRKGERSHSLKAYWHIEKKTSDDGEQGGELKNY